MKQPSSRPVPIFARAFAALFGVIGLTILGFLWFGFDDGFGAPPLFFKVFASLIALGFVIMGFGMALTGFRAGNSAEQASAPSATGGYQCPNCGAGLGNEDVSPSGDVKCGYCSRWFNIHGRRAPR